MSLSPVFDLTIVKGDLTQLTGSRLYALELEQKLFPLCSFSFFFLFSAIICRRFPRSKRSLFNVAFSIFFFTSMNFYLDLAAITLINFTRNFRAKNSNAQSRRIKVLQYYTKDANRVLEN